MCAGAGGRQLLVDCGGGGGGPRHLREHEAVHPLPHLVQHRRSRHVRLRRCSCRATDLRYVGRAVQYLALFTCVLFTSRVQHLPDGGAWDAGRADSGAAAVGEPGDGRPAGDGAQLQPARPRHNGPAASLAAREPHHRLAPLPLPLRRQCAPLLSLFTCSSTFSLCACRLRPGPRPSRALPVFRSPTSFS